MKSNKIDLIKKIINEDIKILNESEYKKISENREFERTIFLNQKEVTILGLKRSRNLCNLYELETVKIKDTITIEQYIDTFLNVFNENKQKTYSEILQIFQEKISQCDDYKILSVLYGISLEKDCNFIDLGDFIICKISYFESIKEKDNKLFGLNIE